MHYASDNATISSSGWVDANLASLYTFISQVKVMILIQSQVFIHLAEIAKFVAVGSLIRIIPVSKAYIFEGSYSYCMGQDGGVSNYPLGVVRVIVITDPALSYHGNHHTLENVSRPRHAVPT